MSLISVAFRSFLGISLAVVAVGCASAEPDTESAEATADELNAEDVLCTFFQCEAPSGGSSSRWVMLGQAEVDGLFDHDRVDVDVSTRFSKLQLRIHDGAVNIHHVDIHFRDGSSFSPDLEDQYREDSRSEVITLPNARRIDYITIDHSKTIFGTGSTVEFWAKR
jgi:hypothetical protein